MPVVVLQGIQQTSYQEPFLTARQGAFLLTEQEAHSNISLIQGHYATFRIQACVCLPTWAAQSSRTVACAMSLMPALRAAMNDGVNLNLVILLIVYKNVTDMPVTNEVQNY